MCAAGRHLVCSSCFVMLRPCVVENRRQRRKSGRFESDPDRQVHAGVSCTLELQAPDPGGGGEGAGGGQAGSGELSWPRPPLSRAAPSPHITAGGRPSYSALSVRAGGLRVRRMEKGSRKSAAHTV